MNNFKLTLVSILMVSCFATNANADDSSDIPSWWDSVQAEAMYLKSINQAQDPKSFGGKWKVLGRIETGNGKDLTFGYMAGYIDSSFYNDITYDERWLNLSDSRNSMSIEVNETEIQAAYDCKANISIMADLEAPFVPPTFWDISEKANCTFDNSGIYISIPAKFKHVFGLERRIQTDFSCRKTYRNDQLICHYSVDFFKYSDYLLLQKVQN